MFVRIAARLEALTGPDGRFLNAGLARIGPDGQEAARVFGRIAPGGPVLDDPGLRLRMASISKAATARAALASGVDPGRDIRDILDGDAPAPIALARLLSHTSGLTDHGGYIVELPASVTGFIDATPKAWSGQVGFFRYANLNFILLGRALERIEGRRFDAVLRDSVLAPAGMGGEFNWAGVADRRALPVWQRRVAALTCEADGPGSD